MMIQTVVVGPLTENKDASHFEGVVHVLKYAEGVVACLEHVYHDDRVKLAVEINVFTGTLHELNRVIVERALNGGEEGRRGEVQNNIRWGGGMIYAPCGTNIAG